MTFLRFTGILTIVLLLGSKGGLEARSGQSPHLFQTPLALEWSEERGWYSVDGQLEEAIELGRVPERHLEYMNRGRESHNRGREGRAIEWYEEIWDDNATSVFASEALYQTALIEIERRKWRKAFAALNRIVFLYPDYHRYGDVVALQFETTNLMLEKGARYFWVIPYTPEERAIAYFEFVVANAPYSPYAPKALMRVGDLYLKRDENFLAIDAFDRVINFYPNTDHAADAYLKLAETYASMVDGPEYDQGATQEAISFFEDYLILFPNDAEIERGEEGLSEMRNSFARSKLIVGDFYYRRRNNIEAAQVFYNEAITASPDSPSAELARERLEDIRSGRRYDTRILPKLVNLLPFFRGADDYVEEEQEDATYNQPGAESPSSDS